MNNLVTIDGFCVGGGGGQGGATLPILAITPSNKMSTPPKKCSTPPQYSA